MWHLFMQVSSLSHSVVEFQVLIAIYYYEYFFPLKMTKIYGQQKIMG